MQVAPPSKMNPMGNMLATARRRKGLSRRVVAELVGRSEEWLRLIEVGQRRLDSIEMAAKLSEVLHIDDIARFIEWPAAKEFSVTNSNNTSLDDLNEAIV